MVVLVIYAMNVAVQVDRGLRFSKWIASGMHMEVAAQDIIFQADDITVTKTLVRTKKASYPVASIGSVSVVPTPLTQIHLA